MNDVAPDSVVLVPPVELDLNSVDAVGAQIEQAFASGASSVVLDFAQVQFCDSAGLRLLVNSVKRAETLGREFRVANPTTRLLRLAEFIGASRMLGLPRPPPH